MHGYQLMFALYTMISVCYSQKLLDIGNPMNRQHMIIMSHRLSLGSRSEKYFYMGKCNFHICEIDQLMINGDVLLLTQLTMYSCMNYL